IMEFWSASPTPNRGLPLQRSSYCGDPSAATLEPPDRESFEFLSCELQNISRAYEVLDTAHSHKNSSKRDIKC
ncbi:hypothetical protein HAX54_008226, partial [Datura stramonium]|nr:hypothetical protein [Datura stramonium]